MKPLSFHPGLDPEVWGARRYYDAEKPGLGDELMESIQKVTGYIQRTPTRCSPVRGNIRKRRVGRFPYCLVFVDGARMIRIIALAHDRRAPEYWAERLRTFR